MSALDGFYPARGLCFVQHVQTAETYANSPILIPEKARDKVARHQMIVTQVGDYEWCADPDTCERPHFRGVMHKHRLNVGDWVICRNRSWMASPDPETYIIRQTDILGVFWEG